MRAAGAGPSQNRVPFPMPTSGSPQLCVVVTRPDHQPAALTAAQIAAELFPGAAAFFWRTLLGGKMRGGTISAHGSPPSTLSSGSPPAVACSTCRACTANSPRGNAPWPLCLSIPRTTPCSAWVASSDWPTPPAPRFGAPCRVLCLPRVRHDELLRPYPASGNTASPPPAGCKTGSSNPSSVWNAPSSSNPAATTAGTACASSGCGAHRKRSMMPSSS